MSDHQRAYFCLNKLLKNTIFIDGMQFQWVKANNSEKTRFDCTQTLPNTKQCDGERTTERDECGILTGYATVRFS